MAVIALTAQPVVADSQFHDLKGQEPFFGCNFRVFSHSAYARGALRRVMVHCVINAQNTPFNVKQPEG
jgi:hypothetical protein